MAAQFIACRDAVDAIQHEADEAVALAPHARHHGYAVDALFTGMHAEFRRRVEHVRRLGRRDQELAGHAADPGAGGAVMAAFDHHRARALRPGGAVGHQARRAGADHGDVDLQCLHLVLR
jgi:hypothetical protein